jgi:hypothetical protein
MPSKQDRGRTQASPPRPWRRRASLTRSATFAAALAAVTPAAATAARPAHRHGKAALSQTFIKEEARLHLSGKNGSSAIVEQGSATGTFNGSLTAQLTVKISTVTGSVVGYLKGGTISGTVSATPHVSGKYVSFNGTFKLSRGTGRYAGSSGTAGFYGVINRETYNATVQLVSRLRM